PLVRAPDAVAGLEAPDAGPNRLDRAGHVATGDERFGQRHGDGAGPDVGVDGVERGGADAVEYLAGIRRGRGRSAGTGVVGGSGGGGDDLGVGGGFKEGGFHGWQSLVEERPDERHCRPSLKCRLSLAWPIDSSGEYHDEMGGSTPRETPFSLCGRIPGA